LFHGTCCTFRIACHLLDGRNYLLYRSRGFVCRSLRLSALPATPCMDLPIFSMDAAISSTDLAVLRYFPLPAVWKILFHVRQLTLLRPNRRLSAFPATLFIDLLICSMEDEICSTELAVLSAFPATCWMDATISCIAAEASSAEPFRLSAFLPLLLLIYPFALWKMILLYGTCRTLCISRHLLD